MYLTHLSLTDFRNIRRLELDLQPGLVLFAGPNAQGKTNLLEAIYLCATTRSLRTVSDLELVREGAEAEGPPAARAACTFVRHGDTFTVEVIVAPRGWPAVSSQAARRIRVNGVPRRATEVVGLLAAVFFSTLDVELVTGPPAARRRFFDLLLAQTVHGHATELNRYARVLRQRNQLLRTLREQGGDEAQLDYWDDLLAAGAAAISTARAAVTPALALHAAAAHAALAPGESLTIDYRPAAPSGVAPPTDASSWRAAFRHERRRELAAGMTLHGPHRDDLSFALNGRPLASFGSRAQQRTSALALRLAEAAVMEERLDEPPVLLLDDILSEFDPERRLAALSHVAGVSQALLTSPDPAHFAGVPLAAAWHVHAGTLRPLALERA